MTPSPELIQKVLKEWRLVGEVSLIRKNENFVYSIENTPYILRFTEFRHRSVEEVLAELMWMAFLVERGVSVAGPLPTLDGNLLVECCEAKTNYVVCVFNRAPGRMLSDKKDYTPTVMKNWGKLIGKMHQVTVNSPVFKRNPWNQDDGYQLAIGAIKDKDSFPANILFELINKFKTLPKNENNYGLIHADVHMGNFHVDDNSTLTLFDFDDAQYNWFAYDIAVPIFSLMFVSDYENMNLNIQVLSAQLLEGYYEEYNLALDTNSLTDFMALRAALLYYWSEARIMRGDVMPKIERVRALQDWTLKLLKRQF